MKDTTARNYTADQIESLLLSARPTPQKPTEFTQKVMAQIKQSATFTGQLRTTSKQPKRSLLMKIRALHGTGLVVAIIVAIALLSGVVYAGVRFTPDLIQLFNKHTNEQGRTEYSVPDYAKCQDHSPTTTNSFAVKPTVHLDDNEVKKIIRAKCELQGVTAFASKTWPTYGQHKEWKAGDTIYYTRPDILGTVRSIDKHHLTLEYSGGLQSTKTYKTFQGKDLQAFSRNQKINLASVKPGDYVFAIERVADTYQPNPQHSSEPHAVGLVAVIKMTLPEAYYGGKQKDIYEVHPCYNNGDETCPAEYPSGIDVFPRGSEGATNPDLRPYTRTTVGRDINGVVTSIGADNFTIKSNKGHLFTVQLPKQTVDAYNNAATEIYRDVPKMDVDKVALRPGSWVSLTYWQDKTDNPHIVQKMDIFKLYLLLDLQVK